MLTKRYSSYSQIESDLEILQVERQLNLQKVVLNLNIAREGLLPKNFLKGLLGDYKANVFNYSRVIIKILGPILLQWLFNRKRG
jgi:hypothetical protein